jgi:hypothetical protein
MFHNRLNLVLLALSLAVILTVGGCTDHRGTPAPSALPSAIFYTLTDNNQIIQFNVQGLTRPGGPVRIAGLAANEQILDIDFRPANNQMYGISSLSRLFIINPTSGASTLVSATPFSPLLTPGASVAIDFNPTVDLLRVVGSAGQNLRVSPVTGAVTNVDGNINGVVGASIGDIAYTNNVPTATTTVLYDIDPVTDRIYQQNPPNNGTLASPLFDGLLFTTTNGFDISPSGQALAGLTINGVVELISITFPSGRTQKLGNLPANTIALAIPTN